MAADDPRRLIPRTDALLADPHIAAASAGLSTQVVRRVIREVQDRARRAELAPGAVTETVIAELGCSSPSSLTPVLNATGVIIHTNLGRAPLSEAARTAVTEASGYVDVELDLVTGTRARRGEAARAALLAACPEAEDALIVNNGAAALVLATTALAGNSEVVISRGELVEIGAGFRLPDLIASTGAQLHEVGTTNRTHLADYQAALSPVTDSSAGTGCVLKVHPSNYWVSGFTSAVPISELRALCDDHQLPLVVDVGSGLLSPDPSLPEEPDLGTALREGADLVIASGDKLLGGPQAGLLLGKASIISRLARHPLARAVRTDKLTLAALEATLTGEEPPVTTALHYDAAALHKRTQQFIDRLGEDTVSAHRITAVAHDGRVGGGGGAGVPLPGWAVQLPEGVALPLRQGSPAVLTRVTGSSCLLDLRCIPESEDDVLVTAVHHALDIHQHHRVAERPGVKD